MEKVETFDKTAGGCVGRREGCYSYKTKVRGLNFQACHSKANEADFFKDSEDILKPSGFSS